MRHQEATTEVLRVLRLSRERRLDYFRMRMRGHSRRIEFARRTGSDTNHRRPTGGQRGEYSTLLPPIPKCPRTPQILHRVAVLWKHLEHPNIVPLLGVVSDPLQLVSAPMPGGNLTEYITNDPTANKISLVSTYSLVLCGDPTLFPAM